MKSSLIALSLLWLTGVTYGAQPTSIGNVKAKRVAFESYTLAQINLLTPDTTNQLVGCTDCIRTSICTSSGSNTPNSVGAFVVPIATGTFVGATYSALPHCQ